MPPVEARATLKGKTGPRCLYMMSAAQCCARDGECAASLAGVTTSEIKKMPNQPVKKLTVVRFGENFPGVIDESALSKSAGVNYVGTALSTAALAFANLPTVEADRWNLATWSSKTSAEKVAWAH